MAAHTVLTLCKVGACEKFCGIRAEVEDGRFARVKFDHDHPVTRGCGCIKGLHAPDYQNDPDRILRPQKRTEAGWVDLGWDAAIDEIGAKLRSIAGRHGADAISTYWGNAADSLSIMLSTTLAQAFGSRNAFNVLSLEYSDRGAVAHRMFGNENLILQPDPEHTRYALLLGTNPLATKGMALLQRRPRIEEDLRAIRQRGGKLVVVDPRRTETSQIASEHLAIRPGFDLIFLLAMIRRLLRTQAFDRDYVRRHTAGFERWLDLVAALELDAVVPLTGLAPATIDRIADEFAAADSAFATTRVGVQTSHNPTLTEWAVMTLNAITGNIDRPGGVFFNPGAVDVPRLIEKFTRHDNKRPSRIGGFAQIFGGQPAATFADDVLSDHPDRIRALVVVAGNPVISFPATRKIEQALARLELLVCIDLYRSDTGAFAHYNLPAATSFEKDSIHFMTSNFEPFPYLEWRPRVVEPRGQARCEWDIYRELSRAAGVPFLNHRWLDRALRAANALGIKLGPELLYHAVLPRGAGLRRLRSTPYGVRTGEIVWGRFLATGLRTRSGCIELAPDDFVAALQEAVKQPPQSTAELPLLLISGARREATFNSWTHNIAALAKFAPGNWATLNTEDGQRLGVRDGARIRVISATGAIEITARLSDDIRAGVVAIHQHWGHVYDSSMRTSRAHPGVNVNHLHSDQVRDRFCGMPVFNGTPCRIETITSAPG